MTFRIKMRGFITIFLLLGIFSCTESGKNAKNKTSINSQSELSNFDFIENFENNTKEFSKDTFELNGYSKDGGELIVFHSHKINYLVLDFFLYGETGKLNYTYWTDKEFKFKFIKQTKFEYDKPYYEEGYKIDSIINFLSYQNNEIKMFDKNRNEISSKIFIETNEKELKTFFNDVTKGIQILK
jgi:hypothetical protein